ncbi:alpha-amylase family glycosyl hydrolase [soil metagenome]
MKNREYHARFRALLRTACAIGLCNVLGTASADPDIPTYPLGANVVPAGDGGGVVFRVWAPNAIDLHVVGQFNGFNTSSGQMAKDSGTGYWSAWVANASVGQEYKYYMNQPTNGNVYKIDPRSRDTINTTGNSIVRGDGSDYPWQATTWQTPDKNRMVIYELHVGTFSGNTDGVSNYPAKFRDVVDTHLNDIIASGANMVELLPVHEFPATSWGYNPVHFFAPESDYGTPDDLRHMVDRLHQNGIGVILDVVYNHVSNTDNNLWNFDGAANIYFFGDNCQGSTPYGNSRPKYTSSEVRKFFTDNAKYWIREFRMDGLRVDSTRTIREYCNEAGEAWLLIGDISDAVRSANSRAITIAEELPNDASLTNPRSGGGAGYNAQWADNYNDQFRTELAKYNSAGSPDMNNIVNAIANSGFGSSNISAVKYVESHDEAGNGERITKVIDSTSQFSARAIGMAKVCGALTYLCPGIPMILQGEEMMENKQFGDASNARIYWGFLANYSGVRKVFGEVGALRQTRGSLKADSGYQTIAINDSSDVISFQRYDGSGDVTFVIANFGSQAFASYDVGIPSTGVWHELVNSDATAYVGTGAMMNGDVTATGTALNGQPAKITIQIPAYAVLVFSKTPVTTPSITIDGWMIY